MIMPDKRKHIEINIGKACNNNCRFCNNVIERPSDLKFVEFKYVKKQLDLYIKKGFNSVGFLGGEFTVHPEAIKIIDYAKKNGFNYIYIVSNGRSYKNANLVKNFIDLGVTRFLVSFHSSDRDLENYLTNRNDAYDEQIAGIKNLVINSKFIQESISINIVINKLNYKYLISTILDLYKIGIRDFRLNYICLRGRAWDNAQEFNIKFSEFLVEMRRIILLAEKLKIHLAFGDIPFCIINKLNCQDKFKYVGELIDNVVDVSTFNYDELKHFQFNWKEVKRNDLKEKFEFCEQCILNKLCEGVWKGYVKMNGCQEFEAILK